MTLAAFTPIVCDRVPTLTGEVDDLFREIAREFADE